MARIERFPNSQRLTKLSSGIEKLKDFQSRVGTDNGPSKLNFSRYTPAEGLSASAYMLDLRERRDQYRQRNEVIKKAISDKTIPALERLLDKTIEEGLVLESKAGNIEIAADKSVIDTLPPSGQGQYAVDVFRVKPNGELLKRVQRQGTSLSDFPAIPLSSQVDQMSMIVRDYHTGALQRPAMSAFDDRTEKNLVEQSVGYLRAAIAGYLVNKNGEITEQNTGSQIQIGKAVNDLRTLAGEEVLQLALTRLTPLEQHILFDRMSTTIKINLGIPDSEICLPKQMAHYIIMLSKSGRGLYELLETVEERQLAEHNFSHDIVEEMLKFFDEEAERAAFLAELDPKNVPVSTRDIFKRLLQYAYRDDYVGKVLALLQSHTRSGNLMKDLIEEIERKHLASQGPQKPIDPQVIISPSIGQIISEINTYKRKRRYE